MSPHLDGDAQRLLRIEPAPYGLWGSTQPALLDDLAALGVDQAQVAVLVSQIQTHCHLRRSFATIVHGPTSFHIEPIWSSQIFAEPRTGYCAGVGLLIPSKVELEGVFPKSIFTIVHRNPVLRRSQLPRAPRHRKADPLDTAHPH
jgi:hypothetical protein